MNLGFDLHLPFFELYQIQGEVNAPYFEMGKFKLYGLEQNELNPADKINHHPLMHLDLDQEIVFYGGSFNPWHDGHQACVDLLPRHKQLVVLPDLNPQKKITDFIAADKWLELVKKINLQDEASARDIYPGFLLKKKSNPTIEWVTYLKTKYPKMKVSLLIGFDQLKNFHTWTQVEELSAHLYHVYVASRLENENEFNQVKGSLERLHLKIIPLGHHAFEDISSTELRKN